MDNLQTSSELKEHKTASKAKLSSYMLEGDIEGAVRTQETLRTLDIKIRATEIRELKTRLEQIDIDLEQVAEDGRVLEEMRKQKNADLAPLIEATQAAQHDVRKIEVSLYANDSRKTSLLETRRGLRKQLEKYLEEIKHDERFEK
jgi:hypothetical protein